MYPSAWLQPIYTSTMRLLNCCSPIISIMLHIHQSTTNIPSQKFAPYFFPWNLSGEHFRHYFTVRFMAQKGKRAVTPHVRFRFQINELHISPWCINADMMSVIHISQCFLLILLIAWRDIRDGWRANYIPYHGTLNDALKGRWWSHVFVNVLMFILTWLRPEVNDINYVFLLWMISIWYTLMCNVINMMYINVF